MISISVIIPVYNVEKEISKCINSLLNQTFPSFELILVDDGSKDNSLAVCNGYEKKDNRIKVISQENQGASVARNTGISYADGQYIAFIDSDDYVDEEYLEKLISKQTDFTCCGIRKVDETGKILQNVKYADRYSDSSDYNFWFSCGEIYSPYCKLFRADIIKTKNIRFPIGITWGEDGMFVVDYLKYVKNWKYIEYIGYNYVKYSAQNSLSTKVRPDILKMIVTSREYCMKNIDGNSTDAINFIKESIIKNCADFVTKTFTSTALTEKEKNDLLLSFLKNPYVNLSLENPSSYYPKNIADTLIKESNNYIARYKHITKLNKAKKTVHKKLANIKEILHIN